MPSTIVKLCSSDARAWRQNQPVWLDESGAIERAVLPEEQLAISTCLARNQHVRQSFRQELVVSKKLPPGRNRLKDKTPVQKALFAFEVLYVGTRRVVTVFLGHLRYAVGREVLTARLLADHGECVLHGMNGKCIGVLRDPFITQRPPVMGPRVQWSKDPEAEAKQAEQEALLKARESSRHTVTHQRRLGASSKKRVYSPEQCPNDCRGYGGGGAWAVAKTAPALAPHEHHPVCMHAAAWSQTQEPAGERFVLYDLETSTIMRAAEPSEVERALEARQNQGVAQVQLQDRIFAVLTEADARQAAREARGENEPAEAQLAPSPDYRSEAPSSSDVGDDEDNDERNAEGRDRSDRRVITGPAEVSTNAGSSTQDEREGWPTLGELTETRRVGKGQPRPQPLAHQQQHAPVTPSDYLSRQVPPPVSSAELIG